MRYVCIQCRETFVGARRWCSTCGGAVHGVVRSAEDETTVRRLRIELLSQFGEILRDGANDGYPEAMRYAVDVAAVAARSDSTLEELARLADVALAWDSWSFVKALGIESDDVRAGDLTRADLATLQRLNGGLPFTYDLDGWST